MMQNDAKPFLPIVFSRQVDTANGAKREAWCPPRLTGALARLRVKILENLAGAFGADARNLAEVGDRGPLDLLQRSEMVQQGPLGGRADAGDFLQAGFADVLLAQLAVRADHEAMGLVA